MTTPFGVVSTGFNPPTLRDILQEIEDDELAQLGPLVDVSADQPQGQINGIFARQLAKLWEVAEIAYNGFDRDKAAGDQLTSLGKLTGTARSAATYARTTCSCDLDAGTVLQSGVNFAQLAGNPAVRFTPLADYTAPTSGAQNVVFRAENAGAVSAPTGTLTVISTPVTGWRSVTNSNDASGGAPADSDPVLRAKEENDLTRSGACTVDSIRDDVLLLGEGTSPTVPQLKSVSVFENTGDTVDANGLPPHSFEVLVDDGAAPDAGNADLIAQAIWDSKPAGIRAFGSVNGTAIDKQGNSQTVSFSRVIRVPIYLTYTLTTDGTYVGNTSFKAQVADFANAAYATGGIGLDVIAARAIATAFFVTGVVDVTALTLGKSPSPSGTSNITIGDRELAVFDSSQITVV